MTNRSETPMRGTKLGPIQQISYAFGNFGVAFSPTVVAAWLGYFYYGRETEAGEPILLVGKAAFGIIWFLCNALNGPTDPIVGYLSDNMRSRWGRRKPWVVLGAPFLALSFFFLWTPATDVPSVANNVILFLSLFGFWLFFTVVVAPYLSLLPEITPYDNERVRISAFMGGFEVLGTIAGNLLPPLFAAFFAGGLLFLTSGFQAMAFCAGMTLMLAFTLSVAFVKETYTPPSQAVSGGAQPVIRAMKEFGSTFRNMAFRPYVVGVGFYRMAVATVVFIAPFIATKIIGSYQAGEADVAVLGALGAMHEAGPNWELAAGYLMMLVMVGAALFFPLISWLAGKLGKRSLFITALLWLGVIMVMMGTIGTWPFFTPLFQAVALFLFAAFPVAIALVVIRPMLADVIDADEKLTGLRREGVYNGMEGLIMKVAAGLGPLIAGLVFSAFGSSTGENLGVRICGPIAGLCLIASAAAFMRYPIKK